MSGSALFDPFVDEKIDKVDAPFVSVCIIPIGQPAAENYGGHGNKVSCISSAASGMLTTQVGKGGKCLL